MKSCFKTLGLEDDAKTIIKFRGAVDETSRAIHNEAEGRLKNTYREAAERCLKSLSFDDIMAREGIIKRPDDETCQWIYRDSQYKRWITNKKSLLWIKGTSRCM